MVSIIAIILLFFIETHVPVPPRRSIYVIEILKKKSKKRVF